MNTLTSEGAARFWQSLREEMARVRETWIAAHHWQALAGLQALEGAMRGIDGGTAQAATRLAGIVPMLDDLAKLAPEFEPFLAQARRAEAAQGENGQERFEKLTSRLFLMHRFLDGVSGAEEFGGVRVGRGGDVEFGLGMHLHDGSLLKFFSLLQAQPHGADVMLHCLEEDAQGMVEAIGGGQACFEQYMRAQLILRYDPVLSKKVYEMPDGLQARLARLGAEPVARRAQVGIVAGSRFAQARQHARIGGIRSLRGFAMLFDLGNAADAECVEAVKSGTSESQKCLTLADSVLARMHGHLAAHWQMRLESVFHGFGKVDDRLYDERRFWGRDAAGLTWDDAESLFDADDVSTRPEPGRTYVVCPGDHLQELTRRAYQGQEDYRFVLRQNPHVMRPDSIAPGTRIYFPKLQDPAPVENVSPRDERAENGTPVVLSRDGRFLMFQGESFGPVDALEAGQRESLCHGLNSLRPASWGHTLAVELPQGAALVCCHKTLFVSDEACERELARQCPDFENPVLEWAQNLAAQIRGDVMVAPGIALPLARLSAQPHRARWMAAALRRVMAESRFLPLRIAIHGRDRFVDIVDAFGDPVVRLEMEDFAAMRQQPWRRLRDYVAPPVMQMDALTQVWLGDLFKKSVEIPVAPLSLANQYAYRPARPGESHFLVPMGTPVYAVMRGTVVDCGEFPEVGLGILIRHHAGVVSRYSSLSTICVSPGQHVEAETMIARCGHLGGDSEPMLRLELCQAQTEIADFGAFVGKPLDYFDVLCNCWPRVHPFDCVLEQG